MSESLGKQLWHAAGTGMAAEVTRLLAAGAEVNWPHPAMNMYTPLHVATWRDHSDAVRVLLSHPGCDMEARDDTQWTPLMRAAARNRLEAAALLLQAGADTQAVSGSGLKVLDMAGTGHNADQALTGDMRQLIKDSLCDSNGNPVPS